MSVAVEGLVVHMTRNATTVAYTAQKRAVALHAPCVGVTAADWIETCQRFGWRCAYCSQSPLNHALQMDHIEPLRRGGAHSKANIAPCCRSCNSSKGNMLLLEWVAARHDIFLKGAVGIFPGRPWGYKPNTVKR